MLFQLLILIAVLGILWFVQDRVKYSKYPPGPPRIPLFGSMLSLLSSKFPGVAIQTLAEKYGDVMHIRMGLVDMIAFTGFDTVHEILAHSKTSDKRMENIPAIYDRNLHQNLGIIFAHDDVWSINRRFTIRSLREYGMGRATSLDALINEEYSTFRSDLESKRAISDSVILADNMFDLTVMRVLWRLVAAETDMKEAEKSKMSKLLLTNEKIMKASNISFNAVAFPFIWDLMPSLSGKTLNEEACTMLRTAAQETIKERRNLGIYKSCSECLVDDYLAKIDETKDDPVFNDTQLEFLIMDLFIAGAATGANFLSYSVVHMLLYPEVQAKIHKEIDTGILSNETIVWDTRARLPYTYAALLESHRHSSVIPFPALRNATEDFYYQGYFIKKGIPLMVNLQGANYCKKKWGDPHNFRPERYLTKEGLVNNKLATSGINFGAGKRVCLGQSMGESTQFTYFASMMRDFKLEKVHGGVEPILEPRPGLTYAPFPFSVRITPRR